MKLVLGSVAAAALVATVACGQVRLAAAAAQAVAKGRACLACSSGAWCSPAEPCATS